MWRVSGCLLVLTVVGCTTQGIPTDPEPPTGGQTISSVLTSPGQDGSEVLTAQQAAVFKVVEAPAGELNVDTLGANATVQVNYPTLAPRDTVGVRLTGVALRDAPIQTVSTVGVLTFSLPKSWITENLNRTVSLTYTYKVGGAGNLITSSPLSIRVIGAQGQAVFKVVEAPAGELNVSTLGANATVQVRYPTLAARDTVGVRLTGVALRDAPIQTVSTVGVLTFSLPKAWIAENLNRTVTLTYTYKVGGAGSLITSPPLSIRVVGTAQGPAVFKVVEAPAGQLNADTLGANATVQVSYPTLAARDTVGVRLAGVTLRDAPIQTVSTVGVLSFSLPKVWITENINRSVNLTFTYKVGGAGSLITSSPLEIRIVGSTAPTDGQRVANELNAQYSNTSNTCPGNKAAYECSGVLIRTVDDSTAFRAWNPSPGAVTLGGVSFSYMKIGIGMNQLQGSRTQGFVLEPGQYFTANGGYPLQVLCSYPYDGGTLIRGAAGCGAASNFPSNSGPCAAQGINTLATWRAHFQQYPANSTNRYHHQCSFGPDQASFALSLTSRENPAAELAAWRQNEVMIKTWPQNTSNLPIKAFIYFNTASRAVGVEGAKNIQRDFLKMTGRRIPVIRVTPNVTTGNIFSYFGADQGI
ncbi:hypothetical protein MO767_24290 [Pseudomonas sp. UYIF39]|uniref:hypothetical protein n=1 Tax=Pseudomonas sp. UYIF39 TaxID=1630747 RepID=UPI00249F03BD|nr:hypothetical protein [Pseudomonas sp. UYIF39]MDI3357447.1 hypothetical protein [Pseudomonas sp. UYIF39]